MALSALKCC